MEGVAAASSVIAVVGLAAQVVQGCNYLRGIFDDAKNAPQELHFLNTELRIIENIVSKIDGGQANEEYQHALDFCLEALTKLRSVVEKYSVGDLSSGRSRQWGPRLAMALNKDKLEKHMTRLREAKGHLEGIRTTAAHNALCLKADNIEGSIVQLSHRHDERSSTMIHGINLLHDQLCEVGQAVGTIRDYCAREQRMLLGGECDKTLLRVKSIFEDVLAKTLPPPSDSQLSDSCSRLLSGDTEPREESTVTCRRVLGPNGEETDIDGNERLWRQSLPELHRKLAELTNASSGDSRFKDLDMNPEWENNAKCGGPFASGEIYLRSTISTYSSFDEMPFSTADQVSDVSSYNTAFPIVVTTTEILLLPKSWMQKCGFHLKLRRVEQASAEAATKVYYGIEKFDSYLGKAQAPDRFVQSNGAMIKSKPGLPGTKESTKRKLKDPSLIMSAAFKVAFSKTGARKPRPSIRSPSTLAKQTTLRQSFDDEINDATELVTLWVEGRLSADFYQDLLHDNALETQEQKLEKLSSTSRNSELRFHWLRLGYVQALATAIVGESERPRKSKEHNMPFLYSIHQAYWDQFLRLAGFWISSTTVNLSFSKSCRLLLEDSGFIEDMYEELVSLATSWISSTALHLCICKFVCLSFEDIGFIEDMYEELVSLATSWISSTALHLCICKFVCPSFEDIGFIEDMYEELVSLATSWISSTALHLRICKVDCPLCEDRKSFRDGGAYGYKRLCRNLRLKLSLRYLRITRLTKEFEQMTKEFEQLTKEFEQLTKEFEQLTKEFEQLIIRGSSYIFPTHEHNMYSPRIEIIGNYNTEWLWNEHSKKRLAQGAFWKRGLLLEF